MFEWHPEIDGEAMFLEQVVMAEALFNMIVDGTEMSSYNLRSTIHTMHEPVREKTILDDKQVGEVLNELGY
jgi:hypothetical protein